MFSQSLTQSILFILSLVPIRPLSRLSLLHLSPLALHRGPRHLRNSFYAVSLRRDTGFRAHGSLYITPRQHSSRETVVESFGDGNPIQGAVVGFDAMPVSCLLVAYEALYEPLVFLLVETASRTSCASPHAAAWEC